MDVGGDIHALQGLRSLLPSFGSCYLTHTWGPASPLGLLGFFLLLEGVRMWQFPSWLRPESANDSTVGCMLQPRCPHAQPHSKCRTGLPNPGVRKGASSNTHRGVLWISPKRPQLCPVASRFRRDETVAVSASSSVLATLMGLSCSAKARRDGCRFWDPAPQTYPGVTLTFKAS